MQGNCNCSQAKKTSKHIAMFTDGLDDKKPKQKKKKSVSPGMESERSGRFIFNPVCISRSLRRINIGFLKSPKPRSRRNASSTSAVPGGCLLSASLSLIDFCVLLSRKKTKWIACMPSMTATKTAAAITQRSLKGGSPIKRRSDRNATPADRGPGPSTLPGSGVECR